uniref:Uncharacterized protein n=1 Tax=Rhizophora mucronata TaxID=61149 RepID=A0A2P2JU36_RHIMU
MKGVLNPPPKSLFHLYFLVKFTYCSLYCY